MRATFRFVHVMRGDKKRVSAIAQLQEKVPQGAPRDRIDARGRIHRQREDRRWEQPA